MNNTVRILRKSLVRKLPKTEFIRQRLQVGLNRKISEARALERLEDVRENVIGSPLRDIELSFKKSCDVTIVMPVYNVQNYVRSAINSVLTQNVNGIQTELILVNDGCTDDTLKIVDEVLFAYSGPIEVKIVNRENGGLAAARTTGIEHASGKYIIFMDSDDVLGKNAICKLHQSCVANGLDIAQTSFWHFIGNVRWPNSNTGVNGMPWGKMYAIDLFKRIQFPENAYFEDTIVQYLLLPLAQNSAVVNDVRYYYRTNFGGISLSSKFSNKVLDTIYMSELMVESQKKLGIRADTTKLVQYIHQLILNARRLNQQSMTIQLSAIKRMIKLVKSYEKYIDLNEGLMTDYERKIIKLIRSENEEKLLSVAMYG